MLYFLALSALAALSLSCWAYLMMRDPKIWRLWWMTRMGIPDLNSTREQKRQQEARLWMASCIFLFVMLAVMGVCIWQVVEEIHNLRNKSPYEQTKELTQKEIEKYKAGFKKLK